ncbi:MAG: site-2 protease family protein [Finegoldia sp.]|nr:site-2 protease family protein [Finegoldia sp.]
MVNIIYYIDMIIALLVTIILHELAHGLVAYWMGDDTAKEAGRLTLNPLAHLDPFGTLSMIIFRFGWARPVPINPYKFRDRKLGNFLVSIAGVTINFILAFISALVLGKFQIKNPVVTDILSMLLIYNVSFGVFNLIPVPPLDGSKVLTSFASEEFQYKMALYERYTYFILIILIFTGLLNRIISPIIYSIINSFLRFSVSL